MENAFPKRRASCSDNDYSNTFPMGGRLQRLQQRLSETKTRLSQSVQELEIPQRLTESKQQLTERISKLDLAVDSSKLKHGRVHLETATKSLGDATVKITERLQKLNLAKLIDRMEDDQRFADALERKNRELQMEQEAIEMTREAGAACARAIESHLESFLELHPEATYEEWISDLHPENLHEGLLLEGLGKDLDHRFYVAESDHRLLWNRNLGSIRREVYPKSHMWNDDIRRQQQHQQQLPLDLLDSFPMMLEEKESSKIIQDEAEYPDNLTPILTTNDDFMKSQSAIDDDLILDFPSQKSRSNNNNANPSPSSSKPTNSTSETQELLWFQVP
jgi:hypothetical protein